MPQSRRRKVRHRSHPGKKHGANRRSDKTVKIVAFLIIAALIVAGVIYLLNRSGNRTSSNSPSAPASVAEFDNATTTASGLK